MKDKAILLIIDPQVDFCTGSLPVTGATDDMSRLAKMVNSYGSHIARINVTLDSHKTVHIAHPVWWMNSKGDHPAPYTLITVDDVENGTWRATNPAFQKWSLDYVKSLSDNNRYVLTVWPEHCRIGTPGACVVPELADALYVWEKSFRVVNYVPKGSCIFTEHYSAVKADVEFNGIQDLHIPGDPTTLLNDQLISALKTGYDIILAGEALDFCLANTVRDIASEFSVDEVKKLVLLEDASSAVNAPGCEHFAKDFLDEMTAKGMQISTTDKYFK